MLWRVFIIWSRDRRVIYVPIVLIVVGTVGRVMIVTFDILFAKRFQDPTFLAQYNALDVVVLSNVIAETWYSTGFICYRLWSMERQKRKVGGASHEDINPQSATNRYSKVMRVLIRSGMLHSIALLAFITCILLQNLAGVNIINFMNNRITGIAATLIILQLNKVPEVNPDHDHSTSTGYSMPVFLHASPATDTKDQTSFVDADSNATDFNSIYLTSTIAKPQSPVTSTSIAASHV
ncbi:hypothetical protein FRB93_004315 [Tulasnella sp. JGI-2019a]|nr:hypothetical protein FRB93_004315 [Tulasnella sp. JGI-2019a]